MFDIVEYATRNKCAVTIAPVYQKDQETGEEKAVEWFVAVDSHTFSGGGVHCFTNYVTTSLLDSMLAELGSKKAFEYGAKHTSKEMREREAFFKGE